MSIATITAMSAPAFKPKKSVALSGVTAGNTALCTVGRTGNDLHYRGYDILDMAEVCEFEEIAHLLVHGKLPTRAELKAYKAKLSAFICRSVGGPCNYTGMDMVTAHKGRGVTDDAFGAVAENLSKTLDQLKVPDAEKKEVMTLIGSLKPAIVQTPAAAR